MLTTKPRAVVFVEESLEGLIGTAADGMVQYQVALSSLVLHHVGQLRSSEPLAFIGMIMSQDAQRLAALEAGVDSFHVVLSEGQGWAREGAVLIQRIHEHEAVVQYLRNHPIWGDGLALDELLRRRLLCDLDFRVRLGQRFFGIITLAPAKSVPPESNLRAWLSALEYSMFHIAQRVVMGPYDNENEVERALRAYHPRGRPLICGGPERAPVRMPSVRGVGDPMR